MEIIKEQVASQAKECTDIRCTIRTNCYGSKMSYFIMLFDEAKKDFPNLKTEDVEVVHYGGRHYKGTFGIEFTIDRSCIVPEDYTKYTRMENLL